MADSDHYTFSPYPSTMQRLVVDGEEVGQHYTMIDGDGTLLYCARVELARDLPPASVASRRRAGAEALTRFGPVQRLRDPKLDALYLARSDAYPFPRDLLSLGVDYGPHEALSSCGVYIQTLPGVGSEHGGALSLNVVLGDERRDLPPAIGLATMLARSALRIAREDRRYRDAYEVLTGAEGRGEPSPEQLQAIMQHVAGATSWVTGQPARVGDAVETRLRLSEVTEDLRGTLHVYWRDPEISAVDVHLEGDLPKGAGGSATLSPEEKGLLAFLKSLGERKVGDQALDDAFFIRWSADDDRGARELRNLVLHSKDHLVELGRHGAHIELDGERLRARVHELPWDAAVVAELISTLLELWRRSVLHCAGLSARPDPTA